MADVQPFLSTADSIEEMMRQARGEVGAVFDALQGRFEAALEERARTAREQGSGKVRRQFSGQLTQALRRLRQFEDESRWSSALLDATAPLCDRAALFTLNGEMLHLQAVRGMILTPDFADVKIAEAPAFAQVAQGRDTVVALRTAGELSMAVAGMTGEGADQRCWLFPVNARERVAAVVYADSEEHIEIEALELVTAIAGLALDTMRPTAELVSIAAAPAAPAERKPSELELRAQRFARVAASRVLLEHGEAVTQGRGERDLYARLRDGIDAAREEYRREFLGGEPMGDYLHTELVRTLAAGNAEALGGEYPGPLL